MNNNNKYNTYLNNFISYLTDNKRYSPYTITSYKKDTYDYLEFLKKNNIDIKNSNYKIVEEYSKYLYKKKLSKRSIARKYSSIRTFYNYLEKNNILENNIFNLLENPKKEEKLPRFINEYELDKMFEIPDNSPKGQRDRLILELLYGTGVRVSELVNIKINDIDFNNNSIKVRGKGNKDRYVFYGKYCKEAINNYIKNGRISLLNGQTCDYLLLNRFGKNISVVSIRKILNEIINKCSLDIKISPHVLRHTFATHLLNEGADIMHVKELLGHSSLSTTSIYTHVTNEKIKEVYYKTHPRAKE
ncbi:tyrosine recombinase XerC [Clostridium sp. CAG:762]|nr:tyrosine recombinase XerC [Clostridium sp. CAG:762]